MQLSLTFVTGLIAAGMAIAAPTPASQDDVLRVPLSKRRVDLHQAPDSFIMDPAKVAAHISSIKAKYAQTLSNLESNTGGKAKRATSNIPLTDQNESFWSGPVQFGGQTLQIDFDTGSSDVVLNEGSYKPGSGAVKTNKTFVNRYGTATQTTQVSGTVYQDSFASGSLKASKASIGLVTSGGDVIDGADGLVGLAYPSISNYGSSYPPLFDSLINQGAVSSKVFGFALGKTGSELTLGGLDSSKYTGSITYVPVSRQAYWEVPAKVNGQSFSSIVDTGTTLVIADTDSGEAQTFFRNLGVTTFTQGGMLYGAVNCNSPPKITFNYGGKSIAMSKESSIFAQTTDGQCVLSVVGASVGQDAWITGDSLLVNTYAVFDRAQNAVGFATRK